MKVKNTLIKRLSEKESSTFNKFRALRAILRVPRLYESFQEAMQRKGQPDPQDEIKSFHKNLGAVERKGQSHRAPNFEINKTFFDRAALCVSHGLHFPAYFTEEDHELLSSSPNPELQSEDDSLPEPHLIERWDSKTGKSEMKRSPTQMQSKRKTSPVKPLKLNTQCSENNFGRTPTSVAILRENRINLEWKSARPITKNLAVRSRRLQLSSESSCLSQEINETRPGSAEMEGVVFNSCTFENKKFLLDTERKPDMFSIKAGYRKCEPSENR